jgi:hypothetical protein
VAGLYLLANALTWALLDYPLYQMPMAYGLIRALPLFLLGMALAVFAERVWIAPRLARVTLLAAAIANAKSKAERMASASGDRLGSVWRMREGNTPDFSPRPIPMIGMRAAVADSAPMAPPAGETALTSTVSVTYELK